MREEEKVSRAGFLASAAAAAAALIGGGFRVSREAAKEEELKDAEFYSDHGLAG